MGSGRSIASESGADPTGPKCDTPRASSVAPDAWACGPVRLCASVRQLASRQKRTACRSSVCHRGGWMGERRCVPATGLAQLEEYRDDGESVGVRRVSDTASNHCTLHTEHPPDHLTATGPARARGGHVRPPPCASTTGSHPSPASSEADDVPTDQSGAAGLGLTENETSPRGVTNSSARVMGRGSSARCRRYGARRVRG
jgi:hypothetical protein